MKSKESSPGTPVLRDTDSLMFAASLCRLNHWKDRTRHELIQEIDSCFKEFTGLQIHLSLGNEPAAECPEAIQVRGMKGTVPERCAYCSEHIWQDASVGKHEGRVFTGACGRLNCRLRLRTADDRAMSLVIQASDPQALLEEPVETDSEPALESAEPRNCSRSRRGMGEVGDEIPSTRESGGRDEFGRAAMLLRIFARGIETMIEAESLKWDLADARRALQAACARETRLRPLLKNRSLELPVETAGPETTAQSDRLVERVKDYLRQHYQSPATSLGDAAGSVHRSASYISMLFARSTGISFHRYLQELRLTKALELLRDPILTVDEVAQSCGYASADWFRHSFKDYFGLSPSGWRSAHHSS